MTYKNVLKNIVLCLYVYAVLKLSDKNQFKN